MEECLVSLTLGINSAHKVLKPTHTVCVCVRAHAHVCMCETGPVRFEANLVYSHVTTTQMILQDGALLLMEAVI